MSGFAVNGNGGFRAVPDESHCGEGETFQTEQPDPVVDPNFDVKVLIHRVERKITPRLMREVALGNADSIETLKDLDHQIAELRAQFVKPSKKKSKAS